jgi:hypothetical protein
MKPTDNINYDFTHDHAGNGWAIVQNLGDNFWKVCAIQRDGIDATRASLVWGKKLNRTLVPENPDDKKSKLIPIPLTGKVLEAVEKLRAELSAGKKKIVDQRVVACEP